MYPVTIYLICFSLFYYNYYLTLENIRGCRDRDRVVVAFTTTYAISAYYH